MPSAATTGWYALGAGVLIGFVLALVGIFRLVGRARALQKKLDGYADLPVLREIELAQARVSIGERALESVPSLQLRATRAFGEIEEARERIRTSLFTFSNGFDVVFSLVFGER
jgi:hypothetical protein